MRESDGVSVLRSPRASTSVAPARSSREGKPSTAGPLAVRVPVRGARDDGRAAWPRRWASYAALGDSFTEGLEDERRDDGRHRGWADRVAGELARHADGGTVAYANLAVRGRLLPSVMRDQVEQALALNPDLVTVGAGVNDAMRRRFDLNQLATDLERGVRALRESGADVVLFSFGDPARRSMSMSLIRERIRRLNSAIRAIAGEYDCGVVDFWGAAVFDDDPLWDEDRLHLSPEGHALVAESVLEVLGLGSADWRTPPVPRPSAHPLVRAMGHGRWVGRHATPWVNRRLRGRSSGDLVAPKDPDWVIVNSSGRVSTGG